MSPPQASEPMSASDEALLEVFITKLRRSMWANAGLLRDRSSLFTGVSVHAECDAGIERFVQQGKASRRLAEARAMSRVARAILDSALARTESRGAHFRNDFPLRDDGNFRRHSVVQRVGAVDFQEWAETQPDTSQKNVPRLAGGVI